MNVLILLIFHIYIKWQYIHNGLDKTNILLSTLEDGQNKDLKISFIDCIDAYDISQKNTFYISKK